jgi:hypothetical protein
VDALFLYFKELKSYIEWSGYLILVLHRIKTLHFIEWIPYSCNSWSSYRLVERNGACIIRLLILVLSEVGTFL